MPDVYELWNLFLLRVAAEERWISAKKRRCATKRTRPVQTDMTHRKQRTAPLNRAKMKGSNKT